VNARFWNPRTNQPCQPPPWAHLMAVNANIGDIAWKVTLGASDDLEAKGVKNTGAFGQGGPIVTADDLYGAQRQTVRGRDDDWPQRVRARLTALSTRMPTARR